MSHQILGDPADDRYRKHALSVMDRCQHRTIYFKDRVGKWLCYDCDMAFLPAPNLAAPCSRSFAHTWEEPNNGYQYCAECGTIREARD